MPRTAAKETWGFPPANSGLIPVVRRCEGEDAMGGGCGQAYLSGYASAELVFPPDSRWGQAGEFLPQEELREENLGRDTAVLVMAEPCQRCQR
jgi:hypothetical protein